MTQVKRLKDGEEENQRLKKMYRTGEPAGRSLQHEITKEALQKK